MQPFYLQKLPHLQKMVHTGLPRWYYAFILLFPVYREAQEKCHLCYAQLIVQRCCSHPHLAFCVLPSSTHFSVTTLCFVHLWCDAVGFQVLCAVQSVFKEFPPVFRFGLTLVEGSKVGGTNAHAN